VIQEGRALDADQNGAGRIQVSAARNKEREQNVALILQRKARLMAWCAEHGWRAVLRHHPKMWSQANNLAL